MSRPDEPRRHARFVAALLPETEKLLDDELYYGPMLRGLNDGLMDKGFFMRPIQCLQEYQKENFLRNAGSRYSGVVFLGLLYEAKLFVQAVVEKLPGPKVILDHHFDDVRIHSVREDAVAGMRVLTRHLLELGHRQLAYLDMSNPDANPWKREGINEALRGAGLPELARGWVAGCRTHFSDVSVALDWFMDLNPRPTAVICFDDIRAVFLLQAAAERGLRVPHDLSIAGFGDFAVRGKRSGALTSVGVDTALMGRRAAELVAAGAAGEPQAILVPPELVVRGTTGPPGG